MYYEQDQREMGSGYPDSLISQAFKKVLEWNVVKSLRSFIILTQMVFYGKKKRRSTYWSVAEDPVIK